LIELSCGDDGVILTDLEYTHDYENELKRRSKYSCQILEIKEDEVLSEKKIRKAFHKCARTWHPDKHPKENKAEVEEKFKRINNAHLFLQNYLLYKTEKINRETFEENVRGISF